MRSVPLGEKLDLQSTQIQVAYRINIFCQLLHSIQPSLIMQSFKIKLIASICHQSTYEQILSFSHLNYNHMKEFQLQEEELMASFRPNQHQQPPSYAPQGLHSPHLQPPHYSHPQHVRAPSQTTPQNSHQPTHQLYSQPRHQRTASPPVVFNYRQNQQPQSGFFQRQSIVQTVGVPVRQPQTAPIQGYPHLRQEQIDTHQISQPSPTSTPQAQPSRGPSQPSAPTYYEQPRIVNPPNVNVPYSPPYYQTQQQYVQQQPQMQHVQAYPQQVPPGNYRPPQVNLQNIQGTHQQSHPLPHVANQPSQQRTISPKPVQPQEIQKPSLPQGQLVPHQVQTAVPAQTQAQQQSEENLPQHQPQHIQYPHPQYAYQGHPPQYAQQQYPYQQEGHFGQGNTLQQEMNELTPEEQQRLWIQQQQQMQAQGQYEYPAGQEGYEYPPEYYQQGYGEITPEYVENLQGEATLWKERFFYLYEKFQTFCEKHEGLNKEGAFLGEQFLAVDSEEQWLALKQKYDSLIERMSEVKQENFLILQQIQQNIQHNQKIENGASIKEEASRVWEHRYHELLEQYQSLAHHYAELQSSSMAHNDIDDNDRMAMMNEKYNRLEAQYNHVVQQLQNSQNAMQLKEEHEDLLKYTQQLQGYIEQLQSQNNNLMRGMKTSVDGSKMLSEQEINQKIMEKDNQIKNLTNMIVNLEEKVKQEAARPRSNISNGRTSQLENQIQEMTLYCNQIQQKLSMKDYEINGLTDKVRYLEEQLHHKQEELYNHTNILQQKLTKIESDIANKASQPPPPPLQQPPQSPLNSFSLEQDYQARIREYQRNIQSKNNQIRILQQRIGESQNQTRKISLEKSSLIREWQEKVDAMEEENRRRLQEKDSKMRALQYDIKEKQAQVQKKIIDKDNAVKVFQAQISSLKEQMDSRLVEKDATIRGLRDTNQRLNAELKDKITEVSRIKSPLISPNMRSPNQSFIAETFRHQEQLRLLTEQLERRSDQITKLKKQRQSRNKQYKDLEIEYQTLQEQNNKRRLQINNLKRQSSAIDNMQLEVENLRNTITKKNQEIGELKNALFELDRVRMELDSAKREVEKQNEISRIKNKDIQQLTDRNYELQEKIRQKDFKLPQKTEQIANRNVSEELIHLQEDNRRKQMEITRLKAENQELNRSLRRETQELQELKVRYPSKLKSTQEQLIDTRLKLSTLQKKFLVNENRTKELQEAIKRVKAMAAEEQNSEASRVQDHFNKLVQRLEEDNKVLKEKIRVYQVKVNELQIQNDAVASKNKELQMFKDQNTKRIISLNDRIEEKDLEIKRIRQKQSNEVLKFRKRQSRTIQLEAALKSRQEQARELQRQKETLRVQLKNLKKEYEDYKQHVIEQMQFSTNKEMQNINKQLNQYEAKFALQNHNFDFKLKDKSSNHVFERTVIYQLKEENDFLRRELEGRGSSISLEKMRITQLQQEALLKSKNISSKANPSAQQEIQFYRQKNRELEERVNSNIATNKSLKERIEQLIESNSKIEEVERQRLRIIDLETANAELQNNLNKLQEQNTQLRAELANSSIVETETYEFQVRIQQLQRSIDQMTRQKHSLVQELNIYRNQKEKLEANCHQFEKSLTRSENKIGILQSQIDRLKETTRNQKPSSSEKEIRGQLEELRIKIRQKDSLIAQESSKAAHFEDQFLRAQQYARQVQEKLQKLQGQRASDVKNESELQKWRETVQSLEVSVQKMSVKINELEGEAEYYKSQAQRAGGVPEDVFYFLEIIRSNYLELEALCSQISIQNQQAASVGQRMIENCRRGLQSCQYINELLTV